MAKVIEATNPHAAWETMSMRTAATIGFYGFAVGVITYVAYLLLQRFVFDPILCRDAVALVRCESVVTISAGMAIVVGSFVGLILLVRERVYRPILAILGVAISLWSVFTLLAGIPWFISVVISGILFGVAYLLFSWLVQSTSLVISVVCVLVVALIARLVS